MVQQLEAREEGNLEIRETFSSLKEEVESKTKKLNKVPRHLAQLLVPPVMCVPTSVGVQAASSARGDS